ncbi:class I SAM-dependent methyltransferase [Paenibacillus lentus]|uniref:SAM-dependent methyltransferase n=1 Tax=Paenibacillus lentus TaxID=1338368 RepID=A0A3Q8S6C2_9BACL|nr:class I SAM-dependent methyltransferase [Paenibacillus lentus]AZK48239.1 SAM-dependent methyltransferase [Paenibacillus lentus]
MGFMSVLSFAHKLIGERLQPGESAIDATAGTGQDTLFLARICGRRGLVYAFDIQPEALALTRQRLDQEQEARLSEVTLLQQSHAEMDDVLPRDLHGKVGAIMFNLGYLPVEGADASVITMTDSTLTALEASLRLLRSRGIVTIVLYPGHTGGDTEARAVEEWAAALPSSIGQTIVYRQIQKPAAPYLIAIEKR